MEVHRQSCDVKHAQLRLSRLNAIGSAMGRPLLMEEFASMQEDIVDQFAEIFRTP
jgi:hypothetical protein